MIRLSGSASLRAFLLSTAALLAPMAAHGQDANSSNTANATDTSQSGEVSVETVVVTGTRIYRPGYEAPTPVTTLSAVDLQRSAPTTLADSLNQLPQFGAATTSHAGFQGGSTGGANFINLRNLGSNRTLVLLNGERVVSSTLTNNVDLNTLPTTLIKRVDVVTGGASATYGSDAVAGVVNLILDTKFTGFKASAQYGNNGQNAYEGYRADGAFGTDFDNGRGHVEASASYFDNPQFYLLRQASWNKGTGLFLNPAYTPTNDEPQLIRRNFVGQSLESQGGVITSGPLANTIFVGPNATPTLYNPGLVSGVIASGGNADQSFLLNAPVGLPQHGYNLFAYGSYDLTPDLTAHLELDYGSDGGSSEIGPYQRAGNITITADNPFIPATIKSQMTALNIPSFKLGSNNINTGDPRVGGVVYPNKRALERVVLGFDGTLGGSWTWNAYYQHGEAHTDERWLNDIYTPYYNLAIDAVAAPAGNAAGIAPGTVVCRSTLSDPTNGCQPLNLFGIGTASPAAVKYITPVAFTEIDNKQDVVSVSAQGEPFSDWAGPVSIAGGGDYRSESGVSYSDPLTYTRKFAYGNSLPFHGAVNVYEGYLETVVPLVRGQSWAQALDFNGAGRVTDYSTSGVVETWKLGLTDQVSDEYRLRVTWSSDIRAPNLSELFTQAVSGGRAIADPFHPGTAPEVLATTTGNPNLNPEVASTVSGGIVMTPNWLPGLSASIDWYSIDIKGAIATITAENELAYCYAGQTYFCSLVHRNSAGVLTEIDSIPTNTAAETTSGLDVDAEYTHSLWGGTADLRILSNYTDETTIVQNGKIVDNAGSLSAATTGGGGQPKFKSTISATYNWGPYSGTVQTRLIGSARLVNGWTSKNVDNNSVPWVGYLDLRGAYDLTSHSQVYFAIDNTLNTPPPSVPAAYNTASVYYTPGSPGTVYDLLGRQYRIGIRANF
jgi:outer membrane receptor protein involved in Fe transport